MLLNNIFVRHSQKVVAGVFVGCGIAVYCLEPYYNVWNRRVLENTFVKEKSKTPTHVMKWAFEICDKLGIPKERAAQLDIFTGDFQQALSFGSLRKNSYAFIALPNNCKYNEVNDIPLSKLPFGTKLLPFTAFSPMGRKLLDVIVMPEIAVKFVLAREITRLWGGGPDVYNDNFLDVIREQFNSGLVTCRTVFMITLWSLCGAIFTAFQLSEMRYRRVHPALRTTHSRKLVFVTFIQISFIVWQQLIQNWRRRRCFAVDRIANQIIMEMQQSDKLQTTDANSTTKHNQSSPVEPMSSFDQPGAAYYRWRMEWNRSYYDIQMLRSRLDSTTDLLDKDMGLESVDKSSLTQSESVKLSRLSLPFSASGNELWLADGDCHSPSASEIMLILPGWLSAQIAALFFHPATSHQRMQAFMKAGA